MSNRRKRTSVIYNLSIFVVYLINKYKQLIISWGIYKLIKKRLNFFRRFFVLYIMFLTYNVLFSMNNKKCRFKIDIKEKGCFNKI